jgi:hypothetical protein
MDVLGKRYGCFHKNISMISDTAATAFSLLTCYISRQSEPVFSGEESYNQALSPNPIKKFWLKPPAL